MFNEDFNEVADQLGREVSTNRNERMMYQGLLDEIRALWSGLEELGWSPSGNKPKNEDAKPKTKSKVK